MISNDYIAGLFDGEGYISFSMLASGYIKCQVGLSIGGDRLLLEEIASMFPGCKVYDKQGTNHTLYTIYMGGNAAKKFIDTLYPLVYIKKADLDFYYEWSQLPSDLPRNRTQYVTDMREAFIEKYKAYRLKQRYKA